MPVPANLLGTFPSKQNTLSTAVNSREQGNAFTKVLIN